MKPRLLFLAFLVAFFTINVAFGETFYVTNPDEFQNALSIADSNREDDTINVAAGTYIITSTLHYISYEDSGHKLTIQGAGADKTVLCTGITDLGIMYIGTYGDVIIKGIEFEFKGRDGDYGGGIYVHGHSTNITIKECRFWGNSAAYDNGAGVVAISDSGTITITNNVFMYNSTYAGNGGSIYASSSSGAITIINNSFLGNSAYFGSGGSIYASTSSGIITITNNSFSGSSATLGGGIYASSDSGTITITNNTFSRNDGSGVYANSESGTVTITNNTFLKNSAYSDGGGVDVTSDSGTITIANNIFSENSAYDGGGVHADSESGTVTITNNTFLKNSAYDDGGGVCVISDSDSATLNIYNNILFGNMANDGDDLYVYSEGSTVNLYNNDFSGNAEFDTGQSWDLYITLTDNYHHADNIQKDPQFVDPLNGDFHLKSKSPCIDRGNNSAPGLPDTDFEGNPRIVGSAPDIGADEYYTGQLVPIPDIKVNNSDGPITLYQNDALTITVSLNNNGITEDADWWLAADTPFDEVYFYTLDEGWTDAWVPGFQGPLFYLNSFEVLNMPVSGLPAGTYTLYFGVDTVMDGNVTWDSAYYDTVEVNIIDLLEKYAPVLKFNFDEQYFPTCIEEMKDWSVIKKYDAIGLDEVVFTSEVTCQKVKDYVDNSNLVVYFDLSDYYQYSFGRYTPTVYGRVVDSHKGGTIYLQYWFFYVRDNKPPPCAHEGDWEMITIELKELKNGTTQPIRVAYSRHLGGEVRPWSEVPWKIEGTHPFVYIAEKSHASYFESGTTFIPVIEEWDAHFGDGKVLAYRKIEALGPDVDVYNLVNINEEPHWCWINIPQLRWGSCSCPLGDGNDGPPSPVAQGDKKWSDPGAWMDSLQ